MTELEKRIDYWKNDPYFDGRTRAAVAGIKDEKELYDCFYRDLEFGTAGMRGVMGAGPNRMNGYVVRRATRGFALYLKDRFGKDAAERGVVIAFDTRNGSRAFAEETALMLCADGIRAFLFEDPVPVPLLSFTVRYKNAAGGVAITASHNPKEYNGFKVYDETGCQLLPDGAEKTARAAATAEYSSLIPMKREDALAAGLLVRIGKEPEDAFVTAVKTQARGLGARERKSVSIVYTPLHGTGNGPVRRVLGDLGFNVTVVREQETPDGDFPTVKTPNPEDTSALALGIELAERIGADLVVGTDPDCDRVGTAVRDGGKFAALTGNQTGALLTYYLLCRGKKGEYAGSKLLKSVVTGEMGAVIAKDHGAETVNVLTGFKYIGETLNRFEKTGERFLIGYEESCGYLVGTHARDKDGVLASMLICEAAAYFAARGKTLWDVLRGLYAKYGYFLDAVDQFTFKGADGALKIKDVMRALREKGAAAVPGAERAVDYKNGADGLPPADLIRFLFGDGSFVAARPSGTEPKIKIYYSLRAENGKAAEERLAALRKTVGEYIG